MFGRKIINIYLSAVRVLPPYMGVVSLPRESWIKAWGSFMDAEARGSSKGKG